ncbi:hypothetical protein SNEBB_009232 [Seison nebaliae]|nr:hypothetical protein SNEBB_009232 [Seison nebaliae]
MAPSMPAKQTTSRNFQMKISSIFRMIFNGNLFSRYGKLHIFLPLSIFLLVVEVLVNFLIINKIKYTEIDWKAYMDEVEGVINGTYNYTLLKGDTGPLVYPAGFVYIYMILYWLTDKGKDIRCAQYIFLLMYIVFLTIIIRIYSKSKKNIPILLFLAISFTSYRIHSLFVLRLFNDNISMLFFYASLLLLLEEKYFLSTIIYSVALSIKMNVLLFAPALAFVTLQKIGYIKTILYGINAITLQFIMALPFLLGDWKAYMNGAFQFSRVFFYKWTVNWRLIPEEIFLSKTFHLILLQLHMTFLVIYFLTRFNILKSIQLKYKSMKNDEILSIFFLTNFIGITFCRSLHYQFYVWYYHSLPFLLGRLKIFPNYFKFILLLTIEVCWNVYPSTFTSSLLLHSVHLLVLFLNLVS